MKKVLASLTIMVLTLTAMFATSGDTLQITAKVAQVKPVFQMYGSFDSTYATLAGSASNTLSSSTDISANDITVNVKVIQKDIAKYQDSFDITITATDLVCGSDKATASASTATSSVANNNNLTVSASKSGKVATFSMTYTNGKPVAAATEIGVASFTWAHDADLPAGDYSATITLGYTAN